MLFNFDLSTVYAKRASNNRPQISEKSNQIGFNPLPDLSLQFADSSMVSKLSRASLISCSCGLC